MVVFTGGYAPGGGTEVPLKFIASSVLTSIALFMLSFFEAPRGLKDRFPSFSVADVFSAKDFSVISIVISLVSFGGRC
ncbi:hypothetical protein ACJX0J_026374 [Zea mays]